MDQSDRRQFRVNVHGEEVSIQRTINNEYQRNIHLLEDNLMKYPPFEDDSMYTLIQMEENIFPH